MPAWHINLRLLMYPYKDTVISDLTFFSPIILGEIAEMDRKDLVIIRRYFEQ